MHKSKGTNKWDKSKWEMNKGSQGLAPYQASLNGARLFDQQRKKQDANGLLRCKQLTQSCKDSDFADLQSKSLRLHLWRVSRSCTLPSKLERCKTFRPWHLDSYSKRSIMGLYGKGRCIGCIGSFLVCAPWARSNGCKSRTCPGSGKCIAEQQGCPS